MTRALHEKTNGMPAFAGMTLFVSVLSYTATVMPAKAGIPFVRSRAAGAEGGTWKSAFGSISLRTSLMERSMWALPIIFNAGCTNIRKDLSRGLQKNTALKPWSATRNTLPPKARFIGKSALRRGNAIGRHALSRKGMPDGVIWRRTSPSETNGMPAFAGMTAVFVGGVRRKCLECLKWISHASEGWHPIWLIFALSSGVRND